MYIRDTSLDVAVIGMAVKLPDSDRLKEFWGHLVHSDDLITTMSGQRYQDLYEYIRFEQNKEQPEFLLRKAAYLDRIDEFDYKYFRFSPKEAEMICPEQRIFLQTAVSAIEDAGYSTETLKGTKTGVYVGCTYENDYLNMIRKLESEYVPIAITGNLPSFIATRLSYLYDLKGPAIVVDTLCSSSIAAVDLAIKSLRNEECNLAIVGGARIAILPTNYTEIGIESKEWKSRPFDHEADGIGGGEGVAVVLLKRYQEAINDQDHIYAVIQGSAVNQNGQSAGITSPNPNSQCDVIRAAWSDANIDPSKISYIEAHGTGTRLGDPIEIKGIMKAFSDIEGKQFCGIGSVKSNLGHLDAAAGIVGLIKVCLALEKKQIPPTIHFRSPNTEIPFYNSPVYVNDYLKEWKPNDGVRLAGISSFGLSGTNCHVIIASNETSEQLDKQQSQNQSYLLTISAKEECGIYRLIDLYIETITLLDKNQLGSICQVSTCGRGHYCYRLAMIVQSKEELLEKLQDIKEHALMTREQDLIYYSRKLEHLSNKSRDKKLEREYDDSKHTNQYCLKQLAVLYIYGEMIAWIDMYRKHSYEKISLPTYPFQKVRCWLKVPKRVQAMEIKEYVHQLVWERTEETKKAEDEYEDTFGTVLVILRKTDFSEAYVKIIKERGSKVITVMLGNRYRKIGVNQYCIRNEQGDYERLIRELESEDISKIYHFASIHQKHDDYTIQTVKHRLFVGVYSLFFLYHAWKQFHSQRLTRWIVVTNNANEVIQTEEIIIPENASLLSLIQVMDAEDEFVICSRIDIDDDTQPSLIFQALNRKQPTNITMAFRQNVKYLESIDKVETKKQENQEYEIKQGGTYIITGGTGGIGLEIARYLANYCVNIMLIHKSKLPLPPEWKHADTTQLSEKTQVVVKAMKEIEDNGSCVECFCADISSKEETENTLNTIRKKYSEIKGIIHCAGIPGKHFVKDNTLKEFEEVIKPKIYGTYYLDELTKHDPLDFFLMFSSGASVIGTMGQGDYVVGNRFMDSYVYRRKGKGKSLCIDWAGWDKVGMAATYERRNLNLLTLLQPEVVPKLMFHILASISLKRILVGAFHLEALKQVCLKELPIKINKAVIDPKDIRIVQSEKEHKKITINRFEDCMYRGQTRECIEMIAETLGYSEISLSDNFMKLGGDSIHAIKIANEIAKRFQIRVNPTDIIKYSSLKQFADFLEAGCQNDKQQIRILHCEEQELYETTASQKRMHVMNCYAGEQLCYNMPSVYFVRGTLDLIKVDECLCKICERHESLRTSFEIVKGQLYQKVHKEVKIDFQVVNIKKRNLDALIRDSIRPFDLCKAPLMRVRIGIIDYFEAVLIFDMHHIISDGTSKNILLKEFMCFYENLKVKSLSIQYRDYAQWQNFYYEVPRIDKMGEYWRRIFGKNIPKLHWSKEEQRPQLRTYEGDVLTKKINRHDTLGIKNLASTLNTTLFTVMLSAYFITLFQLGNKELVIGTLTSGRDYPDTEDVIGLFIHSVAIRSFVEAMDTYEEYIQRLKEQVLGAFEHKEYQIEKVIESLQLITEPSRNPLYDTMFVLQNFNIDQLTLPTMEFERQMIRVNKSLIDMKQSGDMSRGD